MIAELHIVVYVRPDFVRAYKYLDKPKNSTPLTRHMVYSHKAKRYVLADIYCRDWNGNSIQELPDYKNLRYALVRVGLDMR